MTTATRRALVLTLYSEAPVVAGLGGFLLVPDHPAVLVWGIVVSFLFAGPAAFALWAGRAEFGPAQERSVRWAFLALVLLFAPLVLAFYEVTSVFPETMRTTDLRGPLVFLGLSIAADAAAMALMVGPLLAARERRVLALLGTLAVGGLAWYAWHAGAALATIVERSAGLAFVPAEARSYGRDFVRSVVRDWTVAILLLRLAWLPALYRAISNVAEAEAEHEGMTAESVIVPRA